MDAAMQASMDGPALFPFQAIKIALSGGDVCLTTSPACSIDGDDYTDLDPVYGVLSSVTGIQDSIDGALPQPEFEIMPASETGYVNLQSFAEQGARVSIYFGSWNRSAGVPFGAPELMFTGMLDRPEMQVGPQSKTLTLSCITTAARAFEPSDHRRASDSFHQSIWPGERGFENLPSLQRDYYHRQAEPKGGSATTGGGGAGGGAGSGGNRGGGGTHGGGGGTGGPFLNHY